MSAVLVEHKNPLNLHTFSVRESDKVSAEFILLRNDMKITTIIRPPDEIKVFLERVVCFLTKACVELLKSLEVDVGEKLERNVGCHFDECVF